MFFKVINAPRGLLYLISSQFFSDLVSSSRPISAHLMFFHVFSPLLSSSQPVSALPCSSPLLISSQLISSLLSSRLLFSAPARLTAALPIPSYLKSVLPSSSPLFASLLHFFSSCHHSSSAHLSSSQPRLFSAFLVQHLFQTRSRCQSPKNKVGPRTQKQDGTQHTFF